MNDINEKSTYIEFSRRGNRIMVSIRRIGDETHQHGSVVLQYFLSLTDLFTQIREDFDERSTTTS